MALSDGNAVAPRTQVLHAKGISSADLVARLRIDPDVEFAEVDVRVKRAARAERSAVRAAEWWRHTGRRPVVPAHDRIGSGVVDQR